MKKLDRYTVKVKDWMGRTLDMPPTASVCEADDVEILEKERDDLLLALKRLYLACGEAHKEFAEDIGVEDAMLNTYEVITKAER